MTLVVEFSKSKWLKNCVPNNISHPSFSLQLTGKWRPKWQFVGYLTFKFLKPDSPWIIIAFTLWEWKFWLLTSHLLRSGDIMFTFYKSKVKISKYFVAFSEYMKFTELKLYNWNCVLMPSWHVLTLRSRLLQCNMGSWKFSDLCHDFFGFADTDCTTLF
jgi:hypothetical protein